MKAYKMEVLVIAFEGGGIERACKLIENNRYLNATIEAVDIADIGEWTDDHPLNKESTKTAYYKGIFPK